MPGRSGNPAGRPKGSRNRITAACLDLLGDSAEEVMRAAIKRAKRGDGVALRLCLERLVPVKAARDRAVEVDLPAIGKAADLVAAAGAVIDRAARGEMSLSEAREFMLLLEGERKLIETSDLAVRIELLERAAGAEQEAAAADPDLARRIRRLGFAPAEEGKRI